MKGVTPAASAAGAAPTHHARTAVAAGRRALGAAALAAGFLAAVSGCRGPSTASVSDFDPTALVSEMLRHSAASWNDRDLDAFVGDYAPGPGTTFVAGGRVQHGFEWIRANYAASFAPEALHDSLRFDGVEARRLGPDHLLTTARFTLTRGDSVTSSGPFTLVLARTADGWKIIHDHTSRDP